ncbi:hypothetical protein HAX54_008780 [Datura stramonium]|uniref:Late blight resistance protein R1A-like N-terminal domain-containing protein n=1 Tax=Datura stramonium TaxID=4076 RepID=A0ABS8TGL3_DATST|nr:hypothetical protein [Datura stramonium]
MSSERLQQLFDFLNFPKTSIDRVMLFTRERDFQDIFISLQSFTDEPNMLDVSQKIQTLFQDAAFDLSTLYLTEYFDLYASEDIISSVLENIGGLVKIHDPYSPLYVSETEDVSMKLKLLLNFVCFVLERFIEPPQSQHHVNFFTHVLAAAGHASTLIWLYLPDLAAEQINVMFSDFLLMRIKPIQPCIRKIYVDVLQSLKSTIVQSGWCTNVRIENATDSEGSFLETVIHNLVERANIFRVPIKDLEFLLRDIEIAVIDVGLLVYSLYEDEEEKEDMSGNIQSLSIELQRCHSDSLASVMDKLQLIQKEFESLQPFLEAVAEEHRHNDLEEIQHCATQLIDKAHEVEYIVDACINKEAHVWCLKRWLLDIMEEFTLIRAEVAEIREKKMVLDAMNPVPAQTL